MIREGRRAVISSKENGSLYVTLPGKWAKEHDIKRGDKLNWISNGVLIFVPKDKLDILNKLKGGIIDDRT